MTLTTLLDFLEKGLDTNISKVIVLPFVVSAGGFFMYFIKRKVTGTKDSETIAQLNETIELKENMDRLDVTVDDLWKLRAKALSKPVKAAVSSAQYYVKVAQKLNHNLVEAEKESSWPKANTQLEINQQSAERSAIASGDLTSVVIALMGRSTPERATALQQSQDAWTAWCDAEAEREGQLWEGGSIRPLMVNSKREALTRERIAALELDFYGPDGTELKVTRKKTPPNLLDHVKPNVPTERVLEWLGTPHFKTATTWHYRYIETQVEITFTDHGAVSDVVVVLCGGHVYKGSVEAYGDFTLGELTVGSILQVGENQVPITYFESMRTEELSLLLRTGPAGAWSHCFFGALTVFSGVGSLAETTFSWDKEEEKLLSNPDDVLINWVALSNSTLARPDFDWFIRG